MRGPGFLFDSNQMIKFGRYTCQTFPRMLSGWIKLAWHPVPKIGSQLILLGLTTAKLMGWATWALLQAADVPGVPLLWPDGLELLAVVVQGHLGGGWFPSSGVAVGEVTQRGHRRSQVSSYEMPGVSW